MPKKKMNLVWLVAESWRDDMLTPEIMPETWRFAQENQSFAHHYSGGNGTRMGLFSMFYGLYGSYWFPFLGLQQSPVFIDTLQQLGYQFNLHTSQSFSYPELDKTIFSKISRSDLHEVSEGLGWERDKKNAEEIVEFLQKGKGDAPFMVFMFFESTHARYYFPPESVIRKPYMEDLNYAVMDAKSHIVEIKNRDINASHYLDSQIGKILEALKRQNLMEDTTVIITGDHGEEFMEKGYWGHNSSFSEEQTRVPLILHIPGKGVGRVEHMTSHLDIVPTLAPLFGVQNPPEDYSLGMDLFGSKTRDYTVIT
ncbi:MAG: sulfatase-like hydrolase/transferase, partial [Deltaproteobacteria bacterium]|nr:sulfatase-like hydrolase/transferase [Deltaproteobacteria bacterium]